MFEWLKKLLDPNRPKTVADVMSAYGALMEKYPVSIIDVSMLPMPKTQMKVLLKKLYAKAATSELARQYEVAFMFLSQCHDGVGLAPVDAVLVPGDPKVKVETNPVMLEKSLLWDKLSLAEFENLRAEWRRFKEGESI